MIRKEKLKISKELRNIVEENNGIFLLEFSDLSVSEITELRKRIKKHELSGFRVVKNTLVEKAIKDDFPEFPREALKGPTAMAYSEEKFIEVAKELFEFKKETEKIDIKAGIVEGKKISKEKVEELSKIPPKELLLAKVGAFMVAPMQRFLMNLRAPTQNFANLLNNLKNKKEEK